VNYDKTPAYAFDEIGHIRNVEFVSQNAIILNLNAERGDHV